MASVEKSVQLRGRGPWFGPSTFVSAVFAMFANIIPLTVLPLLAIYLTGLYALELVMSGLLCAIGGRSRQIGAGLMVSVMTTAALFGFAIVVTLVREHL
jgi:hypothetical protein